MQMIKTPFTLLRKPSPSSTLHNTTVSPARTWTASGFPAGILLLSGSGHQDGPNTGQPFSTFSGTVPIPPTASPSLFPPTFPQDWVCHLHIIDGTYYSSLPSPSVAPRLLPIPSDTVPPSPSASPSAPRQPPLLSPPPPPASTSPPPLLNPSHSRQHHRRSTTTSNHIHPPPPLQVC
ncbi:hypothetical protein BC829DRAFT_393421 [Chytridium lagenaria]|nr:hypothetical protein BC829DRAFT_393421 [Chytridium lagenaria]